MYEIKYVDHRKDSQQVQCSSFEDAELIAQHLANQFGIFSGVVLSDGHFDRTFTAPPYKTHDHMLEEIDRQVMGDMIKDFRNNKPNVVIEKVKCESPRSHVSQVNVYFNGTQFSIDCAKDTEFVSNIDGNSAIVLEALTQMAKMLGCALTFTDKPL